MPEIRRMPLMGSSINLTQPRKESVNLNMGQQEIPQLKCKEGKIIKRGREKQNRVPKAEG